MSGDIYRCFMLIPGIIISPHTCDGWAELARQVLSPSREQLQCYQDLPNEAAAMLLGLEGDFYRHAMRKATEVNPARAMNAAFGHLSGAGGLYDDRCVYFCGVIAGILLEQVPSVVQAIARGNRRGTNTAISSKDQAAISDAYAVLDIVKELSCGNLFGGDSYPLIRPQDVQRAEMALRSAVSRLQPR